MAQNWDPHCNQKAYGQNGGFDDDRVGVQMESGRTIYYSSNSTLKKEHSLSFRFDDTRSDPDAIIEGYTEFEWFLRWVNITLRKGTLSFYFPDVITHAAPREYQLKALPNWTGQSKKEVSVTFVEV